MTQFLANCLASVMRLSRTTGRFGRSACPVTRNCLAICSNVSAIRSRSSHVNPPYFVSHSGASFTRFPIFMQPAYHPPCDIYGHTST